VAAPHLQAEVTYLKQLMFMNALANAQNPAMLQALATQNPLMAGVLVAACAPNPILTRSRSASRRAMHA
jgi:hypothetical protein